MALTPQEIEQMNQVTGLNKPTTSAQASGQTRAQQILALAKQATPAQPQSNYLKDSMNQQAASGADQINEGITKIQKGAPGENPILGGIEAAGRVGAGIVQVASSPLAGLLNPVGKGISAGLDTIAKVTHSGDYGNPVFQKAGQDFAMSPAGEKTSAVLQTAGDYGTIASGILGADQAVNTVAKVPKVIDSIKNIKYNTPEVPPSGPSAPPTLDTVKVTDLYNRAIKPSVAGKSTAGQAEQASSRAIEGLKAIQNNKSNLSFTNADGEVTTNTTPKSVDQLSQAIGQTKGSIFKQYDALAKQAGEKGVHIDTPKIASELDPVINSKSLALANPEAVKYAQQVQQRFTEAGEIDAQTAQDVIQHYNDSLQAFYRNPNYDTASKAGIDSLIANKLRGALDEGISGATGEQYQALKNQYGALSSMEKDVTHRALVWARQNNVGLAGSLSNMASGAELVRGLLTMNPADIAVSGAIKGVQKYMQYLNNPDVGVSKIFSEIEKSNPPSTGNMSEPTVVAPKSDSSPKPTIAAKQTQGSTK